MALNEDVKRLSFDTRLVDWNIKYNQITPDQLQKHLKDLPDLSDKMERLTIEEENGAYHLDPSQH